MKTIFKISNIVSYVEGVGKKISGFSTLSAVNTDAIFLFEASSAPKKSSLNNIPITSGFQASADLKAPLSHKHTTSDFANFPTSWPASDVYTWAKAETRPTYTLSEIGAAASGHNHDSRYKCTSGYSGSSGYIKIPVNASSTSVVIDWMYMYVSGNSQRFSSTYGGQFTSSFVPLATPNVRTQHAVWVSSKNQYGYRQESTSNYHAYLFAIGI